MPLTKGPRKKYNLNAQSPERKLYVQGTPSGNHKLSQAIYEKEKKNRSEIDTDEFAAESSFSLQLQAGDKPTPTKPNKARGQFLKPETTEVPQKAKQLVNSYTSSQRNAHNAGRRKNRKVIDLLVAAVEAPSFAAVTGTTAVASTASEGLKQKKHKVPKHGLKPNEISTSQECVENVQSCSNSASIKKKTHFIYRSSVPTTLNLTDSAISNVAEAKVLNKNQKKNVSCHAKGENSCDENGSNVQQGLNKRLILCVVLAIVALTGFMIGLYYAVSSKGALMLDPTPVPEGRVVNVSSSNYGNN